MSARVGPTSTSAAITGQTRWRPASRTTASATVTIPQTLTPGTYYIIVRADRPSQVPTSSDLTTVQRVYQSSYANSDMASPAIPVTAGPAPALAVTAVSAPSMASEGQPITVSWTVANDGASTTQSWNDAVYLSLDTLFDPLSAIYLGYAPHTGGLASGSNYDAAGDLQRARRPDRQLLRFGRRQ